MFACLLASSHRQDCQNTTGNMIARCLMWYERIAFHIISLQKPIYNPLNRYLCALIFCPTSAMYLFPSKHRSECRSRLPFSHGLQPCTYKSNTPYLLLWVLKKMDLELPGFELGTFRFWTHPSTTELSRCFYIIQNGYILHLAYSIVGWVASSH